MQSHSKDCGMDRLKKAFSNLSRASRDGKQPAVKQSSAQQRAVKLDSPVVLAPAKLVGAGEARHRVIESSLAPYLIRDLIGMVQEYAAAPDAAMVEDLIAGSEPPEGLSKRNEHSWQGAREQLLKRLREWRAEPSADNTGKLLGILDNPGMREFAAEVRGLVARSWKPEWRLSAGIPTLVKMTDINPEVLDDVSIGTMHDEIAQASIRQGKATLLQEALKASPPGAKSERIRHHVVRGLNFVCGKPGNEGGFRECVEVLCRRMKADKAMVEKIVEARLELTPEKLKIYSAAVKGSDLSPKKKSLLMESAVTVEAAAAQREKQSADFRKKWLRADS
jgi:hypothetical protein